MKGLYNKKKELLKELKDVNYSLDKQILERFNFHYSQTDSDLIIDALDYGTSDLKYNEFIEIMKDFEKRLKTGEWTPNP